MSLDREALLHDAASAYLRNSRLLDSVRMQAWERMGITLPQLRILFRVRNNPMMDARRLAESLSISPSAVSQQVDRLVTKGLLNRWDNPADRRYVCLEITEEGEQATGEISRASRDLIESILVIFTDKQLANFRKMLFSILEEFERLEPIVNGDGR
ncbi:MAG: transcriptional regulator, MarR family [Dehalococcoidia bacterium]|nr:transcriptional regulator, MarR family [Dehalococcoidia bacterium]